MTHIFMRHRVANFDVWRQVFDADAPRRAQAGVHDVGVFRDSQDPENVLVVQRVDAEKSAVKAMVDGMMADPNLAEAFQAAGVLEAPDMWLA